MTGTIHLLISTDDKLVLNMPTIATQIEFDVDGNAVKSTYSDTELEKMEQAIFESEIYSRAQNAVLLCTDAQFKEVLSVVFALVEDKVFRSDI
jgi:hypothetical protein